MATATYVRMYLHVTMMQAAAAVIDPLLCGVFLFVSLISLWKFPE